MRQVLKVVVALGIPAVLVTMVLAQQRGGFGMGGGAARLIANSGVQKEIKMTDDQIAKVKEMNEGLKDKRQAAFAKDLSKEERTEKMTELTKEVEKGLV